MAINMLKQIRALVGLVPRLVRHSTRRAVPPVPSAGVGYLTQRQPRHHRRIPTHRAPAWRGLLAPRESELAPHKGRAVQLADSDGAVLVRPIVLRPGHMECQARVRVRSVDGRTCWCTYVFACMEKRVKARQRLHTRRTTKAKPFAPKTRTSVGGGSCIRFVTKC